MYDYISALCLGESLRDPPVNPLENIPSSLKKQLEGIAPAMGEQFNQEFLRQLRLVLTRTELKSYRDGFQTGGPADALHAGGLLQPSPAPPPPRSAPGPR